MLNQVVMVGRIASINEDIMEISVPRSFKNKEGEYDTDIIELTLTGNLVKQVNENCVNGDIVGVKGRLATIDSKLSVVIEKMTYLTSKKNKED